MGGEEGDVDFKGLVVVGEFKVVDESVGVGEAIAQVGDDDAFGIVDGLANCNYFCHYVASSMASSTKLLARLSSSHDSSRSLCASIAELPILSRAI